MLFCGLSFSVARWREFWRRGAWRCECAWHCQTIHLETVKTVNIMLSLFYHNFFKSWTQEDTSLYEKMVQTGKDLGRDSSMSCRAQEFGFSLREGWRQVVGRKLPFPKSLCPQNQKLWKPEISRESLRHPVHRPHMVEEGCRVEQRQSQGLSCHRLERGCLLQWPGAARAPETSRDPGGLTEEHMKISLPLPSKLHLSPATAGYLSCQSKFLKS